MQKCINHSVEYFEIYTHFHYLAIIKQPSYLIKDFQNICKIFRLKLALKFIAIAAQSLQILHKVLYCKSLNYFLICGYIRIHIVTYLAYLDIPFIFMACSLIYV